MSDVVIDVTSLSKHYDLDSKSGGKRIWALKDVSFSVKKGERVGLIGANGAGKSTLLKILSRVTLPSSGSAKIAGLLGSLLEVGTGFKSTLTGYDNIFLNGALMGFSKSYIEDKLDEIIAFSELDDYIKVPIKYYSSGMKSRLAFSVATYLSPDILLLDEVLSVGDIGFKQKCLERIDQMMESGQTMIFVSHSMGSVKRFCDRVIWLEKGAVIFDGDTEEGVGKYEDSLSIPKKKQISFADSLKEKANVYASIDLIEVIGPNKEDYGITDHNLRFKLSYTLNLQESLNFLIANILIYNQMGQKLFTLPSGTCDFDSEDLPNSGSFIYEIDKLPLLPGFYVAQFGLMVNQDSLKKAVKALSFEVKANKEKNNISLRTYGDMYINFNAKVFGNHDKIS